MATDERPKKLHYTGDGSQFFAGIPQRDLDEQEVAALPDWEYRNITSPNPVTGKALYQKSEPADRKKEPKKAPARKPENTPSGKKSSVNRGNAPAPITIPDLPPAEGQAGEGQPAE